MANEVLHIIQQSELFAGLEESLLREIVTASKNIHISAGEILFQQGDPADAIWGVITGRVNETIRNEDGREMTLDTIEAGDVFGEVAVLDWGRRRVEAVAVDDSYLFSISRQHFLELLHSSPELCFRVFGLLCSHLRGTTKSLEETALQKFPARLAKKLLILAASNGDIHGESEVQSETATMDISQNELARLTGVHRETVNRHLRRWEKKGVIKLARQQIQLLDAEGLRHLAHVKEKPHEPSRLISMPQNEASHDTEKEYHSTHQKGQSGFLAIGVTDYLQALMADAECTLQFLKSCRHIIDPAIRASQGHIVWHTGDTILAEFASLDAAIRAAIDILESAEAKSTTKTQRDTSFFRMGVAAGDSLQGEYLEPSAGSRLASRTEKLAEAGTAYIAGENVNFSQYSDIVIIEPLGIVTIRTVPTPITLHRIIPFNDINTHWTVQAPKHLWHQIRLYHYINSWRYRLSVFSIAVGSVIAVAFFTL